VAVVNPTRVRDFARAEGTLAKTDQLDAGVLARFGQAVGPEPAAALTEAQWRLEDLTARRRQLLEMLTAERNRRQRATDLLVRASLAASIAGLEALCAEVETGPAKVSLRPFMSRLPPSR